MSPIKKIVVFVFLLSFLIIIGSSTTVEAAKNQAKCSLKLNSVPSSINIPFGDSVTYQYSLKNIGKESCVGSSVSLYYADNEMYLKSNLNPSASNYYWFLGGLGRGQTTSFSVTIKNIPDENLQMFGEACASANGASDSCVSVPIVLTPVNIVNIETPVSNSNDINDTQAWIYPGDPACNSNSEYSDGRQIDTLKPEYYTVENNGALRQLTVDVDGCNGYSPSNVADIKAHSSYQYVTVSGSLINFRKLLSSSALQNSAIKTLTNFTVATDFTGVEIDWENFSTWTKTDYTNYKNFLTALQNSLHTQGKLLIIDAPAISDSTYQSYFQFKYEDFSDIDYVSIMAYDYQYDFGVGSPVAPEFWTKNVINWAKDRLDINKIIIGIPTYGYHGILGTYNMVIDTHDQSTGYPGYSTRKLDEDGEEAWMVGNTYYVVQATSTLDRKKALIESMGIKNISAWHLGGNLWFSN
jgi:spore germination protein YaaH